jgi:hypothetical protein
MIWKTLARWAIVAVAVPVAVAVARRASRTIEDKRGSTRGSRILTRVADTADRLSGRSRQPVGSP